MTRNSLERRKVFLGRLASLSVIAFVVALALLSAACNNVNLAGKGSGTVSLAIDEVLASEIRSAIPAHLRSTTEDNSTYTLTASIRGDYSDKKTESATSLSGVTFTFEGIPTGKNIILDVTVKVGDNTIWYGNSGKHMVDSGINKLNVEVGRVSGVLLWKRNVDSGNHNILTAPYGAYDSPGETKITFGASDSSQGTPFCFDGDGNLYVMPSNTTPTQIEKYDLQPDGTYAYSYRNILTNGQVFNHLAYDSVAGTLYGIGGEQAGLYYWKSNENFEPVQGYTDNTGSCLGLAAHDNVVYTIEPGREDSDAVQYATVKSYSISIEESDAGDTAQSTSKDVKEDSFLLPSFCTSNYTGQMIYQDGALYLLLRRFEINDASNASVDNPVEHYSLGALAKIDPNTLTLDTSFVNGGYLGLSSSPVTFSIRENSGNTFNVTYHGSAAENNTFFGPVGFVAVMPKKLVIADAGFSMTDGDDGKVNLKKKARILTVDLEEKVFDDEPLDAAYFQEGYPQFTSSSGYTYINETN